MKKLKSILYILLILSLFTTLTACSLPFEAMTTEHPVTDTPTPTETPEPTESAAPQLCSKEPAFRAEFGVDRFLSQMSDLKSFTDSESEFAYKVLFTAQRDIKNLRYLEISAELTDEGKISVQDEKVLYTLDGMNAGESLVISMALEGYIPDRAISYVDDCGGTHYLYVTVSGEDNVPVLFAFER